MRAAENINSYEELEEIYCELEREYALKDFFYFCRHILKYTPYEITHTDCLEYVSSPRKRKMILLPRYGFKTTLITVSYSIWRLCQDPNIRIAIESERMGQGVDILRMIKRHLEGNEKLRAYYGEFDKGKEKGKLIWREDAIEIAQRTIVDRNPSIAIGSMGTTRVGAHCDIWILDDIVSDNNTQTADQIQKVIDHWKAGHSILAPKGEILLVGTRWDYNDLYGTIIDDKKLNELYQPFIRSAYNPDGSLWFPEILSDEFLEMQSATQGPYLFSCLYRNDPLPTEEQEFQPDWIHYYDDIDIESKDLISFMAIDPAIAQKKKNCDSILVTGSTDRYNNLYIRDYFRGKLLPNEIINKTYGIYDIYKHESIALEVNAFQKSLRYGFNDKAEVEKMWLPIVEIHQQTDKFVRIRRMQPMFAAGKVFIRRHMLDLVRDLMRFPRVADNMLDLLDAIATLVETIRKRAPLKRESSVPAGCIQDIMRRMSQAKKMRKYMGNEGITFEMALKSVR